MCIFSQNLITQTFFVMNIRSKLTRFQLVTMVSDSPYFKGSFNSNIYCKFPSILKTLDYVRDSSGKKNLFLCVFFTISILPCRITYCSKPFQENQKRKKQHKTVISFYNFFNIARAVFLNLIEHNGCLWITGKDCSVLESRIHPL